MKLAGIIIVLLIQACAMLSAHQHKPFEMPFDGPDAKPANWPTNATVIDAPPPALFNAPCELGPRTVPAEVERKA